MNLPAHAVRRGSVGRDPAADSPLGAPSSGAFYTVTVGHKSSSAKNFLPGVNEVSELLKRLSSHTIVSKFSRLTSMPALHQPRGRASPGLGAPSGPVHLAATIEEDSGSDGESPSALTPGLPKSPASGTAPSGQAAQAALGLRS